MDRKEISCINKVTGKKYPLLSKTSKSFDYYYDICEPQEHSQNLNKDTSSHVLSDIFKRSDKDVDKIIARLEEDNKTLAELDKYQSNIGSPKKSSGHNFEINNDKDSNNHESRQSSEQAKNIRREFVKKVSLYNDCKDDVDDDDYNLTSNTTSELKEPDKSVKLKQLLDKIEEDNRKLAELDEKVKKVLSLSASTNAFLSSSMPSLYAKNELFHCENNQESSNSSQNKVEQRLRAIGKNHLFHNFNEDLNTEYHNCDNLTSLKSMDLEKLMEKLEQDNKILAELDKKVKCVSSTNHSLQPLSTSLPSFVNYQLKKPLDPQGTINLNDVSGYINAKLNLLSNRTKDDFITKAVYSKLSDDELRIAEDIVDSIEIPNRGRCRVYIARYSYDPFKQSPNENPEQELYLSAGDFILITGDMDEDGFFFGELLDGRRGLVPSNFIEKLTGEDLFEFQATFVYENRDGDESNSSYPPEFYDAIVNDATKHTNFQHLLAPEDFHRMNDYIDLANSTEIDEEDLSDVERAQAVAAKDPVPPPKRLIVERQLHKSVLIGWLHPDCSRGLINSYQIYVDGVLKTTIPSGERTKALIEGVDSSMPHRISIRAITHNNRMSKDAACTVIIGKNIPFAPCCVKANNISSESALISWLPCNSNFYHVVAVNSVEVRTVGPSIYKHLITGLAANTLYRVSIRAKPGRLLCSDEKNPKKLDMLTTFVDFRTLPKSLPEPPVDIQVEQGPQDGTLLVTWLPVTLDQFGTSNGCPVTGYAVFAAHKKLAEVDSPTGDHALLAVSQIESFHKKSVTVRTKSGENLSSDSMPCQIPDDLLKFIGHRKIPVVQPHVQIRDKQKGTIRPSGHQTHHPSQHQINRANVNKNVYNRPIQQGFHGNNIDDPNHLSTRMTIPSIEITKDTPSESINPIESYSEEEFESSMRMKRHAESPIPSNRIRHIDDFERSHYGDYHRTSAHSAHQRCLRYFVALYDYDPLTMSPNPDAAEEELRFREGDIIKIYGDKDCDGFYKGELDNRVGLVPCNMVSEIHSGQDGPMRHGSNDPWSHLPVKKMIAMYDYNPYELSPNPDAEMELSFSANQIIYVYGDMDKDGFYMGEIDGVRGLVPSNFITEYTADGRQGHLRGRDHRVSQSPNMQNYSSQYIHANQMPQSLRPQGQYGQNQQYHQKMMMQGNKQRPNTLDIAQGTKTTQNQQQSTSMNPFTSLFESGKKIFEDANQRTMSQPQAQGFFGTGQQANQNVRITGPGQQYQYGAQGNQIIGQPMVQQTTQQGLSGTLGGALKSIFKI